MRYRSSCARLRAGSLLLLRPYLYDLYRAIQVTVVSSVATGLLIIVHSTPPTVIKSHVINVVSCLLICSCLELTRRNRWTLRITRGFSHGVSSKIGSSPNVAGNKRSLHARFCRLTNTATLGCRVNNTRQVLRANFIQTF